jgi:hypothetical protein
MLPIFLFCAPRPLFYPFLERRSPFTLLTSFVIDHVVIIVTIITFIITFIIIIICISAACILLLAHFGVACAKSRF